LSWAIALNAAAAEPPELPSTADEKAAPSSPPRCALIDVDQSPVAALAEARLLDDAEGIWLERNEIAKILAEQQLQAAFGADAGPNRVALGRLLKADVLALLRTGVKEKQPYAELVVAETAGGLRILARSIPLSDDAESDADALVALIDEALGKHGETIREVYAVPPFLSRDLSHRYDHLQTAYAALLEESLLKRKGTLVVELAEAEAISREFALAAPEERPQRRLPLYLVGQYRHEGRGEELRVSVTLRARRGADQLGETERTLPPDDVPTVLLEMAGGLLSEQAGPWLKPDADAESQELAERARAFLKLGFWRQASSLCEASLLLKPAQPQVRVAAIEAGRQMGRELERKRDRKTTEDYARLLALRRRAFEHFESLFRAEDAEGDELLTTMLHDFPLSDFQPWRAIAEVSRDLMVAAEEQRRSESLLAWRLANAYAESRNWGACRQCLDFIRSCEGPGEYYDKMAELILRHQDRIDLSGWNFFQTRESIERDRFHRRLLETPELRPAVAARIRRSMGERDPRWTMRRFPTEATPEPPSGEVDPQELTFHPIEVYYTYKGVRKQLTWPTGCLTLDNGDDILWGAYDPLLRVSQRGQDAQVLWAPESFRGPMRRPRYDGERLWLVHVDQLWVIDATTGKSWRITHEHGLPEMVSEANRQHVFTAPVSVIVPIGEGEAVVAGGKDRAWLARVRFSPDGDHRADVFHEAKERSEHARRDPRRMQQSSEYENAWKNPRLAFQPSGGTLREYESDGGAVRQVLIWRRLSGYYPISKHPLIVDLGDWSVRTMEEPVPEFSRCIWCGGELYGLEYERHDETWNLVRRGIAGIAAATLYQGLHEGKPWLLGDAVHVLGPTWSEASLTEDRLSCHGRVPWQSSPQWRADPDRRPQDGDLELKTVGRSNHFGVFVVCRERGGEAVFAQVAFDGTGMLIKDIVAGQRPPSSRVASAPPLAPRPRAKRKENLWESRGGRSYTDAAYSPDGRLLITTSRVGYSPYTVQAWDARDGSLVADILEGSANMLAVVFSRSGKRFATAGGGGRLVLWDTATLQSVREWKAHEKDVLHMAFSWDERCLASTSRDRTVRVWDAATGEEKFQGEYESVGAWVSFVPGDKELVTGPPLTYWDLAGGDRVGIVETVDTPLAFTPGGRLLAVSSDVGRGLIAWDVQNNEARSRLTRTPGRVVATSPDGSRIATLKRWTLSPSASFNPMEVWNVEKQQRTAHTDLAPTGTNWTFSPDGEELFCVAGPGLLWRWRPAQSGTGAGYRTWTDSTGGFSTLAAYLGPSGDAVRLRKTDGSEITVPLSRLSQADRLFADYQSRSATLPEAGPNDLVEGFGQWIDPKGDCKFAREAYELIVTVPGTLHDLTAETGNMDAPRLLQQVEGSFALTVTVGFPSKPDRGGVDARAAYRAAGLIVMLDDNNYLRLEYAAVERREGSGPSSMVNCELWQNGHLVPEGKRIMYLDKPLFRPQLRLERRGSELIPFVSAGSFGSHSLSAVRVPFPERVNVGIAVVNNSSTTHAPKFSHLTLETPRINDAEPPPNVRAEIDE
jgi:WD40 repeat protein